MEGYLPGLLRPPPVPPPHGGGHPGPPPLGAPGPPPPLGAAGALFPGPPTLGSAGPPLIGPPPLGPAGAPQLLGPPPPGAPPGAQHLGRHPHELVMGGSPWTSQPPGLGALGGSYRSIYGDAHQELLAHHQRAAELDYQRLAESQRMDSLRAAEARYLSSAYPKDPLAGLLGPPYSTLYDPYRSFVAPPAPPPPSVLHPPVSSPGYPASMHPPVSSPGYPASLHPPVSSSPGYPGATNNSSLSDRLRVGFGDKSPNLPSRSQLIQDRNVFTTSQATLPTTLVTSSQGTRYGAPAGSGYRPTSFAAAVKVEDNEVEIIDAEDVTRDRRTEQEEEEEEVLVDDFDGECCRTYPYNHSKILRWKEERRRKQEEEASRREDQRRKEEAAEAKRKADADAKRLAEAKKKEEEDRERRRKEEEDRRLQAAANQHAKTESMAMSGSIPVGIVSARQRTDQDKQQQQHQQQQHQQQQHQQQPHLIGGGLGALPLPPSGPLVGLPGPSGGLPWPSTAGPPPPPPWHLPGGPSPHSYPPPPPWATHPMMMGPIPMGYQLAKDPMTGQILLIPTGDPAAQRAGAAAAGLYDPTTGPPPPPTSSASQHLHHLMMQQHHHLQYLQHQELLLRHQHQAAAAAGLLPPMSHRPPPRVPETITVSDDEDDEVIKKSSLGSVAAPQQPAPAASATAEFKPPTRWPTPPPQAPPSPVQVKMEPIKKEVKLELMPEPALQPTSADPLAFLRPEAPPVKYEQFEEGLRSHHYPLKAELASSFDEYKTEKDEDEEEQPEKPQEKQPEKKPINEEEDQHVDVLLKTEHVAEEDQFERSDHDRPTTTDKDEKQDKGGLIVEDAVAEKALSSVVPSEELCVKVKEEQILSPDETDEEVSQILVAASPSHSPTSKKSAMSEPAAPSPTPEMQASEATALDIADTLLLLAEASIDLPPVPASADEPLEAAFAVDSEEAEEVVDPVGLDILCEGIEFLERLPALPGIDLLCNVTRNDTFEYKMAGSLLRTRFMDLDLLCSITQVYYEQEAQRWVDPLVAWKQVYRVRQYRDQAAELRARQFIEHKLRQHNKEHPDNIELEKFDNIRSLAHIIKKIKNMEIMSQQEVELRMRITELQNLYRDKQGLLHQLRTPRKKNLKGGKSGSVNKLRGPGRPKKKTFPNPRAKMGRPRKQLTCGATEQPAVSTRMLNEEEEGEEEEDEEDEEQDQKEDVEEGQPPVLELQVMSEASCEVDEDLGPDLDVPRSKDTSGELLRPPCLTNAGDGGSSDAAANTSLSSLTSKFMKGKASPFANLLSKLAVSSGPNVGAGGGGEQPEEEEDEEDEEEEEEEEDNDDEEEEEDEEANRKSGLKFGSEDSGSEASLAQKGLGGGESPAAGASSGFKFGKTSKLSYCLQAYRHAKKRKAERPKKNSGGSSETIVPKKPRNLFMMVDFQRGFKSAEDEYNFQDSDAEGGDEEPEPSWRQSTSGAAAKLFATPGGRRDDCSPSGPPQRRDSSPSVRSAAESGRSAESFPNSWTDEENSPQKRKKKKKKKKKKRKEERGEEREPLRSAELTQADLKDGLRILVLQEGKFWPARLNSTKLGDVFGVVMDRQRGNRPIILPRDDLLKEAVVEVRPQDEADLPVGARVCTYWSSAYACLFPATVSPSPHQLPQGHVLVELDDGDSRLVDITRIRMLPHNYSRVVYDPDPIASLRRRRISTDSQDSGQSLGIAANNTPVATGNSSSSTAVGGNSSSGSGNEDSSKYRAAPAAASHKRDRKVEKTTGRDASPAEKRRKSADHHEAASAHAAHQTYAVRSPPRAAIRTPPRAAAEEERSSEEEEEEEEDDSDHNNSTDEDSEPTPIQPKLSADAGGGGGALWRWVGEGYRRPGGKAKSKKVFYKTIQRGRDQLIHVNDSAVFLSTGRSDRPYIGRIEMMWETASGAMMTKVKWFYHPQEIETCGRKFDLKLPGGLFQSPHTDENSVWTISHKCEVLPIKEYIRQQQCEKPSGDVYYLAGSYDPAGLTLNFQPGVLKATDSD